MEKLDSPSTRDLMRRIAEGRGTLEDRERWLQELKQQDPYFDDPGLEMVVQADREAQAIYPNATGQLTRAQMVRLVERIWELTKVKDGDAEEAACLIRLERCLHHPRLDEIISAGYKVKSAEEVVDEALSHKPIALGPISPSETT
jgi:hypothetical protein